MRAVKNSILILSLMVSVAPAHARSCLNFFNLKSDLLKGSKSQATEGFIAYLDILIERRVIRGEDLERLFESLKKGEIQNPIDQEKAELDSVLYEHYLGFQDYLLGVPLDLNQVLDWIKKRLEREEVNRNERSQMIQETIIPHHRLSFNPIPAGEFRFKREGEVSLSVTLTHPFEVMSTPVTQWMWFEVMDENPAFFNESPLSMVALAAKEVPLQPDHPVENLTWWSALIYANRLSEKEGFPAAYDLSEVIWKEGTSAEDGTLEAESGWVTLNAPDGDYYQIEGYRLPTLMEQEYLLKGPSEDKGKFYFGNEEEASQHAWVRENPGGSTKAVAELEPLVVGNSATYDLLGNVYEWGWDGEPGALKSGKNPVHSNRSFKRILHGGAYNAHLYDLSSGVSAFRNFWRAGHRTRFIGLRLVRTLDAGSAK